MAALSHPPAACGSLSPRGDPIASRPARLTLLLAFLLSAALAWIWDDDPNRARLWLKPRASPPQPTQILIILDTFRFDTASVCGHDQPTTPTLEALAGRDDAQLSCRSYTPGDWTLPSHASYFTGVPPLEHGAHGVENMTLPEVPLSARPLDERFETMAETFRGRGFQTLSVSANPIISDSTGMTRGFDLALWDNFDRSKNELLVDRLRQGLLALDPDAPLFLFLNITDAHLPWAAIPEGHPYLESQPGLSELNMIGWQEDRDPEVAERFWPLYLRGVEQTDSTLADSLEVLSGAGWLDDDSRVVITSDHGEMLLEHGITGHGGQLYEPNNRVLFMTLGPNMPELPELFNAMEAHPILLEGELRDFPVEATAFPMRFLGEKPEDDVWLGAWEETDKWVWNKGQTYQLDLATDPDELKPELLEGVRDGFDPERALRSFKSSSDELDPGMIEMLRAAGYLD